jgi:hypothetical protein
MNFVQGALDWFARLGLTIRDDAPKTVDLVNRDWGEPVDGLALSIREISREDPDQLPTVSAVLRNVSQEAIQLRIPAWLRFYSIQVIALENNPASLTPFGRELLKPQRHSREIDLNLAPGEAIETEVPLGSMCDMRTRGRYRVDFRAILPNGLCLDSNQISIDN